MALQLGVASHFAPCRLQKTDDPDKDYQNYKKRLVDSNIKSGAEFVS